MTGSTLLSFSYYIVMFPHNITIPSFFSINLVLRSHIVPWYDIPDVSLIVQLEKKGGCQMLCTLHESG